MVDILLLTTSSQILSGAASGAEHAGQSLCVSVSASVDVSTIVRVSVSRKSEQECDGD